MSLKATIEVVAHLAQQGVIRNYAIAGAVGALNYIQPTLTEDLDILVSMEDFERRHSGLILLAPIEAALAEMGYSERADLGIMVEGWPVQFLPAASPLDEEALAQAVEVDISLPGDPPVLARCVRAEHLVAAAAKIGRLKDLARIEAFLDQGAVDVHALRAVLERHALLDAWRSFCSKSGRRDPLDGR